MKLIDKQVVEATNPKIYIGRRTYVNQRTGQIRIAGPYWAQYCLNGKQHQQPLGTPNKATAKRAAYALAERLERGEQRIQDGQTTIRALTDRYFASCQARNRARKTLVKYRGQLDRFAGWCEQQGIRKAKAFTPDDLYAYRTYLTEQCHLSPKTIYNETIVMKQLFKWATREDHLARNTIGSLRFEKVRSPKQPCFTMEQVELLLSNAEPWVVPIFSTLAFTGMRIGELRDLRWEDVDLERNVIHICYGGSDGRPKNKEDRFVPIHTKRLRPILQSLPRESDLVFLMPNGRRVNEKKLREYLKRLCAECGFDNPRQYKLHTFRHFFASYCAQQNLSYKYALEWMGHSSSAILDLYFTMNDRHSQKAMNSMSFSSDEAPIRTVLGQSGGEVLTVVSQTTHV